ncbi:TBC1 domain protein [Tritrichomonas foetus]|uniref:TBC1 domain protein n=1 Tax=Tritrichomonas foetus TaxID=1144522 RepID=A0A1J4K742_9EUKA|nr:TBC1 domain protein [Tritrichomonas foetus]|eukprot:OHT06720.1 TBC1 domain protein [Tritrichomonas foetus]
MDIYIIKCIEDFNSFSESDFLFRGTHIEICELLIIWRPFISFAERISTMSQGFIDPPLQFKIMPLVQPNPSNEPIDRELIRHLCESGLSECPAEDRCLAWLVLLNVYPKFAIEWPEKRDKLIQTYMAFVHDYGLDDWPKRFFTGTVRRDDLGVKNGKLMLTIYSDISRSGRQFFFFPPEEPPEGAPDNSLSHFIVHMRRLERILYVFGSLNASLSYMQGFNELVSPLYFAMVSSRQLFDDDLDCVEAISFHCLQELITGTKIQEFYMTQDESSIIYHKMGDFQKVLDKNLPNVSKILEFHDIHPLQYAYKCLNLLFAQEHPMPTILIIWDALFAHIEDLMDYCYYVEVSRIAEGSHKLSYEDFASTVQYVQNIDIPNIYVVLRRANKMYMQDKKPNVIEMLRKAFHP